MKKVIIIDYKLGNLFSVKQACDTVGIESKISSDVDEIINADGLILPGVGAFNEAMKNLNNLGISYKNLKFYQKAETYLLKILDKNPNYINALVNLGNIKNDIFYLPNE